MNSARAIVIAHGQLAQALVSAVELIAGRGAVFQSLSNDGLAAADVARALAAALDATGAHVVFTDLPAGSCTLAARRLMRERPALRVVAGVNLPMLLEYALRETPSDDDVAAAAERGRDSIRALDDARVR
jgi:mannose/fructose-specific phosphotransferase system component IIA